MIELFQSTETVLEMAILMSQRLSLLIPPPVVMVITGLLMWLTSIAPSGFLRTGSFSGMLQAEVAWGFYLLGAALLVWSIAAFILAKTTVNPMRPAAASSLLTTGVFAFSRNPIYLADLFLLIGWGIALGNMFNFLWLGFFVGYITRFQIIPEEQALVKLFGDEYLDYCAKVRRWL